MLGLLYNYCLKNTGILMKIYEKGFFKRNKKVLLVSFLIFLIFSVGGAIYGFLSIGDGYGVLSEGMFNASGNITRTSTFNAESFSGTINIFTHNLLADSIMILGGIFFSVISVLIAIFNALVIGVPFGGDLTFFSLSVLPHGIIEYSATVVSLAAAFSITKLEIKMIKNRSFKNTLKEHKTELKDILVMIIIVVVLLFIAAIIEVNITPLITEGYYFGF